jgi:hypothetical protein
MAVLTMGKRLAEGYALYGYHIARGWAEKVEEEVRIKRAAVEVFTLGEPQEKAIEVVT